MADLANRPTEEPCNIHSSPAGNSQDPSEGTPKTTKAERLNCTNLARNFLEGAV